MTYCPVPGCPARLDDDDHLYAHLTSRHGLTAGQASAELDRQFKEMQWHRIIGKRYSWRGWTLDSFPADDESGGRALQAARQWLGSPGEWCVYIDGPPGTGKT